MGKKKLSVHRRRWNTSDHRRNLDNHKRLSHRKLPCNRSEIFRIAVWLAPSRRGPHHNSNCGTCLSFVIGFGGFLAILGGILIISKHLTIGKILLGSGRRGGFYRDRDFDGLCDLRQRVFRPGYAL